MTDRHQPSRRQFLQVGTMTAGLVAALTACSDDRIAVPAGPSTTPAEARPSSPAQPVDSWAPRQVTVDGLAMTCSQQGDRLALHTRGGDRGFLAGVGLLTTLPGGAPAGADDVRRWLPMMGEIGVRVVRLDRLAPPEFYAELQAYNESHPDAPLFLLQGVEVEHSAGRSTRGLTEKTKTEFLTEIADVSAAVHGDHTRPGSRPSTQRRWRTDVSPWIVGWLLAPEMTPSTIAAHDAAGRAAALDGTYFATARNASRTEVWLAGCMEALAAAEAKRGSAAPIAVVNTPETDPLPHPDDPMPRNDRVAIDVTRIVIRPAWPAGTFAAYRAYPFEPLFLALQPSYQGEDRYRAYLLDLKRHHRGTPMVVTEFGVPSALGRAGIETADRDGGGLSEQQALSSDADMLRMFAEIGLSGGLLRSWTDEWGTVTSATAPRHRKVDPARRALWHDPLSSSQWFGLVAHDPARAGEKVVHENPSAEMTKVTADQDASYLYLTFHFTRRVTSPVEVGFDLFPDDGNRLPGGAGKPVYDVAIRLIPTMSTTTVYVRRGLDPVRLDGLSPLFLPRSDVRGWSVQRLTLHPAYTVDDETTEPRMQKTGELVLGTWDPTDPAYSSLATWQLVRPDPSQPMEWRLRLPWSLLCVADPSGRQGLVPDLGEPTLVEVPGMDVLIESSTPGSPARFHIDIAGWNRAPRTTERLRAGIDPLTAAFAQTARPAADSQS